MANIHLLFTLHDGSIHDVKASYSRSLSFIVESLKANPDVVAVKTAQSTDLKYLRVNRDGEFTYSRLERPVAEALSKGTFHRDEEEDDEE